MLKIKLNNLAYRYDVYQLMNIFYFNEDIKFDCKDFDYEVYINENNLTITHNEKTQKIEYMENLTVKENIRRCLFLYLREVTGYEIPWGILLGIRPTKIALNLMNKGKNREEIVRYYREHYLASEEKGNLCIDVAKKEAKLVNKESNVISVYVGMPFCPTRCLYCSFASNPIARCKKMVEPYLKALSKEIAELSKFIKEKHLKIQCVYFGGGTPTSVNDEQFEFIVKEIYNNLVKDFSVQEFTIECGRPDSITENKLKTMKHYNVNRISINPQTMNKETLKLIGRGHSVDQVKEKFMLARKLGFNNINMDIIVGLPGENAASVDRTCNEILKLNPESLTVHGMAIKRGSKLHEQIINNIEYKISNQEELNIMFDKTVKLSQKLNMEPYYMYRQKNMVGSMENVGYCKTNKECIYNIQMMEEKQTVIALGADAVCKVIFLSEDRIERFANLKDVKEYVNRVDEMIQKKIDLLNTLY